MSKQYKLLSCTINGKKVEKMIDVRASLTDVLRDDFRLTSVKKGCEVGECGACNVLIDGECFNSCIYLAVWAEGREILTLEGLAGPNGEMSDIQQAFIDEGRCPGADSVPRAYHERNGAFASPGSSIPMTKSASSCPATCAAAPDTRISSAQ